MVKLTIKTVPPMPREETQRNVEYAKSLGFPRWGKAERQRLAVVGGGPSIIDRVEELKAFDGDIWAINGAWRWCKDHGIDAWFFTVDQMPVIAEFAKGAARAILTMECDPSVFDVLRGAHVEAVSLDNLAHGPSSSTSVPCLAPERGFREIHFFGCEGSFAKTTHAYGDYGLNMLLRVECNGETFLTSADMLVQVEFLGEIIRQAPDIFHDRSGGLLSAFIASPDVDILAASPSFAKDIIDGMAA